MSTTAMSVGPVSVRSKQPELTVGVDIYDTPRPTRDWARKVGIAASESIYNAGFAPNSISSGPIDVVDLFCGCGGLSAGFEFVGRMVESYRLAAAVDFDPWACSTYARNLPIQPILADLSEETRTKVKLNRLVESFRLRPSAPLILIGGPPCQGFSAHRKKNFERNDQRNQLVSAFARVVNFLEPDLVLFENVPEVLSERHWHYFRQMQTALRRQGYTVRAQIHNLGGFGVPQERFRAIIMASRRTFDMPVPYVEPKNFRTVRDAIGSLEPVDPGERCSDPMHFCTRHRATTIRTIRQVPKDGGRRPAGVGPRCLDKVDGFRDVYGRMYWDRPANTITAYARNPASGRYVHPSQDRGLTIREAALLQGFPPDWVFEGPFDHKFLQIGNAVPPIFSAFVAAHVLGELLSRSGRHVAGKKLGDVLSPTSNSFSSGIAGRKKGVWRLS
jgi:DNA (cytosine-5)-methyltransferase 1